MSKHNFYVGLCYSAKAGQQGKKINCSEVPRLRNGYYPRVVIGRKKMNCVDWVTGKNSLEVKCILLTAKNRNEKRPYLEYALNSTEKIFDCSLVFMTAQRFN